MGICGRLHGTLGCGWRSKLGGHDGSLDRVAGKSRGRRYGATARSPSEGARKERNGCERHAGHRDRRHGRDHQQHAGNGERTQHDEGPYPAGPTIAKMHVSPVPLGP